MKINTLSDAIEFFKLPYETFNDWGVPLETQQQLLLQLRRKEELHLLLKQQQLSFWVRLTNFMRFFTKEKASFILQICFEMNPITNAHLIDFFCSLHVQVIPYIIQYTAIKKLICCVSFSHLMQNLSLQQQESFFIAMQSNFPNVVSASSCNKLLEFCSESQREVIYHQVVLQLKKNAQLELISKEAATLKAPQSALSSFTGLALHLSQTLSSKPFFDSYATKSNPIQREATLEDAWCWLIKNAYEFYQVMMYLPPKYQLTLYQVMKNKLAAFIQNASDFYFIMSYLPTPLRTDFYEFLFPDTTKIKKTVGGSAETFELIDLQHTLSISQLINNEDDFKDVFIHLLPSQCTEALGELNQGHFLPFKNMAVFVKTLQEFSVVQFQAICEAIPKILVQSIQQFTDFKELLSFSSEKQFIFFKMIHPYIDELLKKCSFLITDDDHFFNQSLQPLFKAFISYCQILFEEESLSIEIFIEGKQRPLQIADAETLASVFLLNESWQDAHLKTQIEYEEKLIKQGSGIKYFLTFWSNLCPTLAEELSEDVTSSVHSYYPYIKKQWNRLIKNSSDFNAVFEDLAQDERNDFFTLIESIIPQLIQSALDFKLILMHLNPSQRSQIVEIVKQDLISKMGSIDELKNFLCFLSPSQINEVFAQIRPYFLTIASNSTQDLQTLTEGHSSEAQRLIQKNYCLNLMHHIQKEYEHMDFLPESLYQISEKIQSTSFIEAKKACKHLTLPLTKGRASS